MTIEQYIAEINTLDKTGKAKEHSYRPALQQLISTMLPNVIVINDGARIECGAPDFQVIEKANRLPVFYVETKPMGDTDLDGKTHNKEQFDRYKKSLSYVIFTDYLEFHFYIDEQPVEKITLIERRDNTLFLKKDNQPRFESLMSSFGTATPTPLHSATALAEHMAEKARLLESVIYQTIERAFKSRQQYDEDEDNEEIEPSEDLVDLYEAFKSVLNEGLNTRVFADLYAQTVTYGLFAARLQNNDDYKEFSRLTAGIFIPKTYPLLRQIFQSLTSSYIDDSFAWIIDDLVALFRITDVKRLLESYYNSTHRNDPMIRFYEDFLHAYDPQKKDICGVYYTPEQVVSFMVRSVDEILQSQFDLPWGLADYSTIEHEVVDTKAHDPNSPDGFKRKMREFHRVQILDPATGTGTFLAEIVKVIYSKFQNQPAMWQPYVDSALFPRLNGFEFMMAPYSIAHIKLDLLLAETGYKHTGKKRLNIYLADSLKEPSSNPVTTNFAYKLSREIKKADRIKRDKPIMVMVGNPPYNGESINKGEWIMKKLEQYKREPGLNYNIKDTKWVNDDYVKFIRLAQNYIERGGKGVVAYINPHGYLDNPTFRGMRYELLKAFDEIRIINLHGNSKKKERCPDGSKDENVFNILQGVCINIFIKTGQKQEGELAKVFYADVWGKKRKKLDFLKVSTIKDLQFTEVRPKAPRYYFVPMDYSREEEFFSGLNLAETFGVGGVGMCTKRDSIAYQHTSRAMKDVLYDFKDMSESDVKQKYGIKKESGDQKVAFAQKNIQQYGVKDEYIHVAMYRPFDKRYTYLTNKSNGFIVRPVYDIMHHFVDTDNLGLIIGQQGQVVGDMPWNLAFITDCITDLNVFYRGGGYVYPLYVTEQISDKMEVRLNIKPAVLKEIEKRLGKSVEPHELLYYIYAILHSNYYREIYKPYLDYNFPHIPFPQKDTYPELANLGKQLVNLHLMHQSSSWAVEATYHGEGDNKVAAFLFEKDAIQKEIGKVKINETQYFDHISEIAYNFHVGGYQPLQKWLKDRKGEILDIEGIRHYQEIVYAITETLRLMNEIDKIYQQQRK
ncbi:MAG: N-6 DNA methylase [Bacteroidaceae bacterium]|nr:N-6 DNA methylase [Bacteroidaceae bacterium]